MLRVTFLVFFKYSYILHGRCIASRLFDLRTKNTTHKERFKTTILNIVKNGVLYGENGYTRTRGLRTHTRPIPAGTSRVGYTRGYG